MQNLKVIYEDNHVIVVVKPHNVPSQEDETKDEDMLSLVKKYIKETDEKVNKMFLDQVNELNSSIKWETVVKPLIELKLLMLCK